jgi:predicted transcriptional regulator
MSALNLGNVPDELLQRLQRLAEREQRSTAEAAVHLLTEAVAREEAAERARVEATLSWIQNNRITPPPGTPDSTEMLREDRER